MLHRTPDPDFGRLRTALLRGTPDRVPLCELIVSEKSMSEFLGKPVNTYVRVAEFQREAGYDFIRVTPRIDWNPEVVEPEDGRKVTPATGEDKIRLWADEKVGVVPDEKAFERHHFPEPHEIGWAMVEECLDALPDGMKLIGHQGDIFTQVWELIGFENFCFCLVEKPEFVARMFERVGQITYDAFVKLARIPEVGALWYSDDIAYSESLMVGPEVFREHLFPWMKKIGDLAKERGIPYIYHTDGKLWPVMEDIIACGVDALHPIEPKAMDIVEVKQRYGDRLALIGNIDLAYTLTRGTPEDTVAEVRERLRTVGPGGGYVCGSANTIPDYVKTENYIALLRTVLEEGGYPISIG